VTMCPAPPPIRSRSSRAIRTRLLRVALAALLGIAAALLISCSGSGAGLIPSGNSGPLQSDFETVAQAAASGDGSCTVTETAILKTEQDYAALPSTLNGGLRERLHQGISNLRVRALDLCAQPLPQSTVTSTTPKTTTSTTPTVTETTPTVTTPTVTTPTVTTPTTSGPGGGTPAPGSETPPAAGGESGGGGVGVGEAAPGGQEATK
jgi:hypothetical protein